MWLIYLAGVSIAFDRAKLGIFQTLASKRRRGASGVPLSRADLYRQLAEIAAETAHQFDEPGKARGDESRAVDPDRLIPAEPHHHPRHRHPMIHFLPTDPA